jgi:aspartyl-tRNA(Asn)/glutamyl-tRNA(Gln) amidotransferase subunit B
MDYEVRVGMECHAELLTESKMFCGCKNEFGGEPNTRCCPVCLGLPGSLPVFNKKAVEHVVRTALALNCQISLHSVFHRKNYFYPDLPKGYQISQYGNTPIGINGWLEIEKADGTTKKIHITRVHLEEDTGKSIHSDGAGYSVMDYNRSGVPLMEIVTAFPPDVESAEEARLYAETLRSILLYLGVSDGKMEQGSLRVEPNPSVRPGRLGHVRGEDGTEKPELVSQRAAGHRVRGEAARRVDRERRHGRSSDNGLGRRKGRDHPSARQGGRAGIPLLPEPDLIPLQFDPAYVEELRQNLPELPNAKKRRLIEQYGLPAADAAQLVAERATADFYEAAVKDAKDPKAVANWMLGDLARLANAAGQPVHATPITPTRLAELVTMIDSGAITGKIAKTVIEAMFAESKSAQQVVQEKGLTVQGADEVAGIVARIVQANLDVVAKIKEGNEKSKGFLVGQVMKETRGRAKPDDVNRCWTRRSPSSEPRRPGRCK